jgi:hypothetical protein
MTIKQGKWQYTIGAIKTWSLSIAASIWTSKSPVMLPFSEAQQSWNFDTVQLHTGPIGKGFPRKPTIPYHAVIIDSPWRGSVEFKHTLLIQFFFRKNN